MKNQKTRYNYIEFFITFQNRIFMQSTQETFLYLATFFLIYSFIGWLIDSWYKSYSYKKLCNWGFMYGPYCPIFGIPAIIMIIYLYRLNWDIWLFFFAMILIMTFWEYMVWWWLETIFHKKYWDYSDEKLNYKGRICLKASLTWWILSVLFVVFVHPFVEWLVAKIPVNTLGIIMMILSTLFFIDFAISTIKQLWDRFNWKAKLSVK